MIGKQYWMFLWVPLLALAGCGPLIPQSVGDREYFVIEDDGSLIEGIPKAPAIDIVVRDATSNRFIGSHKIIFSSDPTTRGYYQLAQWVEPPPKRVSSIVVSKLERANIFKSVTRASSATRARFQLNLEVTEYYHDISTSPGNARIRLVAELVNLLDRTLLAQQTFASEVPVEDYSARGAVMGLNAATNQILGQVVVWAAERGHALGAEPDPALPSVSQQAAEPEATPNSTGLVDN